MNNLVIIEGKKLTTTSLVVSESFGRRHDFVLRSIDKLIKNNTIGHLDFEETSYLDKSKRKSKCYKLTERGFLIAMPFIGGRKSEKGQIVLVDAFLKQRETISKLIQQQTACLFSTDTPCYVATQRDKHESNWIYFYICIRIFNII